MVRYWLLFITIVIAELVPSGMAGPTALLRPGLLQAAQPAAGTEGVPPKTPEEAIKSFKVRPGFHVELVAAEPLIQSPVAISFGPDGRLWVAEMWDYPAGQSGQYEPGGRVRFLVDEDGDGRYDRGQVFLDGIPFPTGLTVWNKGVLICAAPDILYAEDTDGDGRADVVRKLFSGFSTHNFHSRVNSLEYGLDGWTYGAVGGLGMKVTSHQTKLDYPLGRRDFRMKPDTGELEAVSGATQQGRVRNDWDDWFGCNNLVLLQHYPLSDEYIRRNPFLKLPTTILPIAAGPDPGRLFSIADQVRFKLSGPPNRPTAVCGIGVYRDDLFGDEFAGNVFSCESVNNLVHRQILKPDGPSFTGHRDDKEQDCEFLASSDAWFRPVQARTGLDGGLWIVDMYRYVIEHPVWIPPETLTTLDPRAGADMGRIYRIVPDKKQKRKIARFDQMSTADLAAALESKNGAQRDLVQQMIQWRHDKSANPQLAQQVKQSSRPEVRMQSLWTWTNLVGDDPDPELDQAILNTLSDPFAGVRRQAIRMAEKRLSKQEAAAIAVARLIQDSDFAVRMQVAYSLGQWNSKVASEALATLLIQNANDSYLKAAIESSFSANNVTAILASLQQREHNSVVEGLIDQVIVQTGALGDPETALGLIRSLSQSIVQTGEIASIRRLAGLLDACGRRVTTKLDLTGTEMTSLCRAAIEKAKQVATDDQAPAMDRISSLQLLAQGKAVGQIQTETLFSLLTARTAGAIQSVVVKSLTGDESPQTAEKLLTHWDSLTPAVRNDVIDLISMRPAWIKTLLTAIQQRSIAASQVTLPQQQALLNHVDSSIQALAEKAFHSASTSSRTELIEEYRKAGSQRGDASIGKSIFQKQCSTCHRIHEMGTAVGPDLASYGNKPVEALLIAMLDPNQAVESRFQSYTILMQDGRSVTGLITEETAVAITLLQAEGKQQTIPRSDIDEMRNTGKSLMPEGFEKQVSKSDFQHLWAYVESWKVPFKTLSGNQPSEVALSSPKWNPLTAAQAEIYGNQISFATSSNSVINWSDNSDSLRWRIQSPKLMEFDVWSEWACAPDSEGSGFRLEGNDSLLTGKVSATGAWDKYQFQKLGTIRVREGPSELVLKSDGQINRKFADVRAIHLVSKGGVPEAAGLGQIAARQAMKTPADFADYLLNDRVPQIDREKAIADASDLRVKTLPMMIKQLPTDSNRTEEYRRIPWIWRVSIAISKSGNLDQIQDVLSVALPTDQQPLEHWQAVILGGAVINGISQSGEFPLPVIQKILSRDGDLNDRWQRAMELSIPMCDDTAVPDGTRYDALRMCAMLGWKQASPILLRYIPAGSNDELQLGAIGGLNDLAFDEADQILLANLPHLTGKNRRIALNALLRTERRSLSLLQLVDDKQLAIDELGPERIERLKKHGSEAVRKKAAQLLAP